jgi:hypothetical protein
VFGSKAKETLVEQSSADMTSAAVRAGATSTSVAEKARASTAPPTEGEQDDLFMADSRPTPDPHTVEAGGAHVEDDAHLCLYVGIPWEKEVVADRRDVDEFKEASRTIGRVLSIRVLFWLLDIFALSRGILQGLISGFACSWCSLLLIGRRLE